MIRLATVSDIPELLRMGAAFHSVTGVADIIPLDEQSLANTMTSLIETELGVIIVLDSGDGLKGATAALLHPHYFNANHRTGMELFWWVDPEHRGLGGKLFDALEAWVRANGADSFSMLALEALEPEKVGLIYRRRGYRPLEHSYIKRI